MVGFEALKKILIFFLGSAWNVSKAGLGAVTDAIKRIGIIRFVTILTIFGSLLSPLSNTIDTGNPEFFTNATSDMVFKSELDISDTISEMQAEDLTDLDRFIIGFGILGFFGIVYWIYVIISVINKKGSSNESLGGVINIFWTLAVITVIEAFYIIIHPEEGYTMYQGVIDLYNNFDFYVASMNPMNVVEYIANYIVGIPSRISLWFSGLIDSFISKITFWA